MADGSGTLETEQLTWIPSQQISTDQQILGLNADAGVVVPLLASRAVTRGSTTFTTTNSYGTSNFNDYGRPYQISENGPLSRSTTRSFQYGFAPYIVDKVASETVTVGGESFTKSYAYLSSNGFLSSQSIYGVGTSFSQDGRGNVASVTDANSHTTSFSYQWGRVSSTQTPAYSITRSINSDGTVASETRRGFTTTFDYDALERVTRTAPAVGNAVSTSYDNSGGASFQVTRSSSSVTSSLDGFGRISATQNSVGVQTDFTFDACGRRTYESYPFTSTNIGTTSQYDGLARVKAKTNADGTTISYAYSGINVTITDENGHQTQQTWQAFGDPGDARLSSVTDAASQVTSYSYNAVGSLTSVAQSGTAARSWSYNSKNQLTSETQPESGAVGYGRDAVGNMISRTDAKGQTTSYTYDGNNRLTQVQSPNSLYTSTITYDASDNRTLVQNGVASTSYTYDGANRPTDRIDTINGHAFALSFGYDGNDWLTSIRYGSGRLVNYSYDAEGRVASATETGGATYASQITHHPSGAITSFLAGNGLTHTATYDARYRVQSLNAGGLLTLAYGYDSAGNVTSVSESTRSGMNQSFSYDSLDRLTAASGVWGGGGFAYDGRGNRLSKTVGGAGTSYAYDAANRLQSAVGAEAATFAYDASGNLTTDEHGGYTYTPTDMMETATVGGATTTYRYDADGLRVLKIGTSPTSYYSHGLHGVLLAEYEEVCPGQFQLVRDYVYAGDRLIAAVRPLPRTATVSLVAATGSVAESVGTIAAAVRVTTPDGGPLACGASVQYATANGTAVAGADYTAASGTLTFPAGTASGTTQTVSVPILGDNIAEGSETFSLSLSNPAGAMLGTATEVITILDDDPTPTLSIAGTSVSEGAGAAVFGVTLSGLSAFTITVAYTTADQTATAGQDYVPSSGTLTFAPGTTTQTITVPVVQDALSEGNETFTVTLSSPVHAAIQTASATGTIIDDDPLPALSINSPSMLEGNAGTTPLTFTVALSAAAGRPVSVEYAAVNGTAVAGTDFLATTGTLTFPTGTTTATLSVPIVGDLVGEPTKSFSVQLVNPIGATIAVATGLGTVWDDDPATVRLTPTTQIAVASAGGGASVQARVLDGNGAVLAVSPSWTSADTTIATVQMTTPDGAKALVRGVAAGTTTIAATAPNGVQSTVSVTVTDASGSYADQVRLARPAAYWRLDDAESFSQAVLSDLPLGYWRLGEAAGATAADASGYGRTGTYSAGVSLQQPGSLADGNTAALLDGSSGAITVGNVSALAFQSAFSVEAWVNFSSNTAPRPIAGKVEWATKQGWVVFCDANAIRFVASNASGTVFDVTTPNATYANGWHHVVGTWDGTSQANGVQLAVDGIVVRTGTAVNGAPSANGASFVIGAADGAAAFAGTIDEVAVYGYALSAPQIANHYALRSATIAGSGPGSVHDEMAGNLTGTIAGGISLGQPGALVTADHAAAFDGQTGVVTVADASALGFQTGFSVEAWINVASTTGQRPIAGRIDWATKRGWALFCDGATLRFVAYTADQPAVAVFDVSSPTASPAGTWHHVVATWDHLSASVLLWIDGVAVQTAVAQSLVPAQSTSAFALGGAPGATLYNGQLDEVAVYDYPLTPQQVAAHFALRTAFAAPLVTYPANGAVNADLTQPITWTIVPNVQAYVLYVGTTLGAHNLVNTPEILSTSYQPSSLLRPDAVCADVGGGRRRVALRRQHVHGGAADGDADEPGEWRHQRQPGAGVPVDERAECAGVRVVGGDDGRRPRRGEHARDCNSTSYQPSSLLPANQTLYARMWTEVGGVWRSVDSTFTTAPLTATLTSPANGATSVSPALAFQWTSVPNVQAYVLWVGTTVGTHNVVNTPEIAVDVVPAVEPAAGESDAVCADVDGGRRASGGRWTAPSRRRR